MNHQFFVTVLTAVLSSGGGFTILQWWLNRRENRRMEAEERRQLHAEEKLAEHDAWLKAADKAYRRVSEECETCAKKLDRIGTAFYGLLDDLEEEIFPMLVLPNTDQRELQVAMRASMRKAREAAR
jgi:hypothetical protein